MGRDDILNLRAVLRLLEREGTDQNRLIGKGFAEPFELGNVALRLVNSHPHTRHSSGERSGMGRGDSEDIERKRQNLNTFRETRKEMAYFYA